MDTQQSKGNNDGSLSKVLGHVAFVIGINTIVILLLPLILLILLLFIITYTLTDIYLKIKYGKSYGGLLCSGDAVWKAEDQSRSIINIGYIVNAESTNPEDLIRSMKTTIQKRVFDQPERFPKLTSICKSAMGYGYLLRNQLTLEDVVTVMDTDKMPNDILNQESLTSFMSSYGNRALPRNHEALWELVIFPKSIQWSDSAESGTQFPMLMRISHIAGDGFTIFTEMCKLWSEDSNKDIRGFNECVRKVLTKRVDRIHTKIEKLKSIMRKIGLFLYVSCMIFPVLAYQFMFKKDDRNCLHGPQLKGEKHLVFAIEKDDQGELMSVVRDIRKRIYDASFSSIVFTAFSASLNRYFEKVSAPCPESMSFALTAMLTPPQKDGSFAGPDNKFSLAIFNLPVNTGPEIIRRFQAVKKSVATLAKSPDFIVNHMIMNHFVGIIPVPLQRKIFTTRFTGSLSIVPGLPYKVKAPGHIITDIVFFTPHKNTAGIGLTVLTYNNRFQLGLIADKAVLPEVRDAQSIVDETFRQIYKLHESVTQSR